MTYTQLENQYTPAEKELFVSYKRITGNGDIVHNWGSYCNAENFKRDWHWFKQQIISCDVIDMRTKRNWYWEAKTGWLEI